MAPDSYRYKAMGAGDKTYPPFNRRILFPFICGDKERNWLLLTKASLVLLPLLVALYVYMEVGLWQAAVFSAVLMAGMPCMRFWFDVPILTDAPALCLALVSAILPWPFNLFVAALGGLGRETVPIFAALYAWNPLLLLGLIPVGIWTIVAPVGPDQMKRESWLDHPFKTAQDYKRGKWRSPEYLIYPWGVALIALFYPTWQLASTLVVAYSQLFVATDWARLYVWAAPVMYVRAAQVGVEWMIPLSIIHWFNYKRGPGT